MNSFLLSLLSPVLYKTICGSFKERVDKRLNFEDIEEGCFVEIIRIACGEQLHDASKVETIMELAKLSDRLQMTAVTEALENKLVEDLKRDTSIEILEHIEAIGLQRLQKKCYLLLQDQFQQISGSELFLKLSEETLGKLLDEDELGIRAEEDVFEAVVKWMTRRSKDELYGENLLKKIRFGVVRDDYLAERMVASLPGNDQIKKLVGEALSKKRTQNGGEMWDGVQRLCDKWLVQRRFKETLLGVDILEQPKCVAIDGQGRILVSDWGLHQVVVLNWDGSLMYNIGSEYEGAGSFYALEGIAVDRFGNIFVADSGHHQIQVFSADHVWVRCFGSEGTAANQLLCPQGLAIDAEGRVVVADTGNHRIQVFNPDGNLSFFFGLEGNNYGQLYYPAGVAVDGAGRIVVADCGNNRVQVFNSDASVALCIGSRGHSPGQFLCPRGVAVDREGRVIVSDNGNHRIQVFSSEGRLERVVGGKGTVLGKFDQPIGVAVDLIGRIFVVDHCNGRVQVL